MSVITYGTLRLDASGDYWLLKAEPHVSMMAKRVFAKVPSGSMGEFRLPATPETSRDLEWFISRYALDVSHPLELKRWAKEHVDTILRLSDILDHNYEPRAYELALPARDYQRIAADWFLRSCEGLLADQVGLGKTVSAICAMASGEPLPVVVACMPHLQEQWKREITRFAPKLNVHIIKSKTIYRPMTNGKSPDVIIVSYHKLGDWAPVLGGYANSVCFDECQELRRMSDGKGGVTQKYAGAKHLADNVAYRWGLSGTPIFNYGGEIYNVMDVLTPGKLGEPIEFYREWCTGDGGPRGDKFSLREPAAFGSWMRSNYLMMRRTREDVGRELDALTRITHTIESNRQAIDLIAGHAGELARIILSNAPSGRGEKMAASAEFDAVMRQATGIAKAPYVAAFVDMLVQDGEQVVLFGWHRACYEIWRNKLDQYNPAIYTGSESPAEKERQRARFINRETPVIMISLRSGAGLDGLQHVSRTVVFGELDWSPAVHEQCWGRVLRDGQTQPVTAYFLVSEDGLDPTMAEVLGLKRSQSDGLLSTGEAPALEQRVDSTEAIKRLAEQYVRRRAG